MSSVIRQYSVITITDQEAGRNKKYHGAFLVEKEFDPCKERERYAKTVSPKVDDRKFVDWLLREGILTYAQLGNLCLREPKLNDETGEKTHIRYDKVPSLTGPFEDPNTVHF